MNDKARLFITGIVALGAVGVTVASPWRYIHINDDERSVSVPLASLKDFDGITVSGPDDVVVTPGDHYAVSLEGSKDAAKYMEFEVREGVLHVARRSHGGWFGSMNSAVTVHVTMPGLSRLWISGSGNVQVKNFSGKALRATLPGSGNLEAEDLKADTVALSIQGSGEVKMSGTAKALIARIDGSGNMELGSLKAETATLDIHGSGNIDAHASQTAKLNVAGSGDAHVSGTTQCQINKAGSGDAECTS